jgi:hypothetical protein
MHCCILLDFSLWIKLQFLNHFLNSPVLRIWLWKSSSWCMQILLDIHKHYLTLANIIKSAINSRFKKRISLVRNKEQVWLVPVYDSFMETTNASSIWSAISEHDDLWQHSTSKSNINTPHCIICPSGNIVSVVQMTGGCDMWWGGGASLYRPLSPGLINGQQAAQSSNTVWHRNTWVACLLQPASLETEIQYSEDSIPPGSTPSRPSLENKCRNKRRERNGRKSISFKQVSFFLLSDKHKYIDLVYLVYLTLQHVSAVHIRHHQVGRWYTKRVKGKRILLANCGCKIIMKKL